MNRLANLAPRAEPVLWSAAVVVAGMIVNASQAANQFTVPGWQAIVTALAGVALRSVVTAPDTVEHDKAALLADLEALATIPGTPVPATFLTPNPDPAA